MRIRLLILLLSCPCVSSPVPDASFFPYVDSLFTSSVDSFTHVRILRRDHTWFLVSTGKTIPVPYHEVLSALQDINAFRRYFSFMSRSEFVSIPSMRDSIALFEVGFAFYVAWYAGRISRECVSGPEDCRLICGNVNQQTFRSSWNGTIGGLVQIRSHDVYIEWRVKNLGGNSTRIALSISQAPAVYIPQWLLKAAVGRIFPGMIVELQRSLQAKHSVSTINQQRSVQ